MKITKMADLELRGKRLLIREDLNVPVKDGVVTSDARIKAALPTIQLALEKGASVYLMSHLGRPKEGEFDQQFSLAPVADHLSSLLGREVPLVKDYLDGFESQHPLVLLENVRFNRGEKKDDDNLARQLANLCDVFVMDAFGTAHRAQASTHGVAKYADEACAGPLLVAELDALGRAMSNPARPLVAIVGGSKVSTKLTVLRSLCGMVDKLIVGGGIANTFVAAAGYPIGASLCEQDLLQEAQALLATGQIPLPLDVVVGKEFSEKATATIKSLDEIEQDDMILDIGPKTAKQFEQIIGGAGTIIWNGPVGVFEFD